MGATVIQMRRSFCDHQQKQRDSKDGYTLLRLLSQLEKAFVGVHLSSSRWNGSVWTVVARPKAGWAGNVPTDVVSTLLAAACSATSCASSCRVVSTA